MNPAPEFHIDKDLTLRMRRQSEAAAVFAMIDANRKFLGEWLPWPAHVTSLVGVSDHISKTQKGWREGTSLGLGIFLRGRFVGMCGYNRIDTKTRCGTIGYWLAESAQGKGIMTRAVKSLVTYGFQTLGLQEIKIDVAEGNVKSQESRGKCEKPRDL